MENKKRNLTVISNSPQKQGQIQIQGINNNPRRNTISLSKPSQQLSTENLPGTLPQQLVNYPEDEYNEDWNNEETQEQGQEQQQQDYNYDNNDNNNNYQYDNNYDYGNYEGDWEYNPEVNEGQYNYYNNNDNNNNNYYYDNYEGEQQGQQYTEEQYYEQSNEQYYDQNENVEYPIQEEIQQQTNFESFDQYLSEESLKNELLYKEKIQESDEKEQKITEQEQEQKQKQRQEEEQEQEQDDYYKTISQSLVAKDEVTSLSNYTNKNDDNNNNDNEKNDETVIIKAEVDNSNNDYEELYLRYCGQEILLEKSLEKIQNLESKQEASEIQFNHLLSNLKDTNEKLNLEKQELFEKIKALNEENQKLNEENFIIQNQQNNDFKEKITLLETECKRINSVLLEKEEENYNLEKQIIDLKNDLQNLHAESKNKIQELNNKYIKETVTVYCQTDENDIEIFKEQFNGQLKEQSNEIITLKESLQNKIDEITDLTTKNELFITELKQKESQIQILNESNFHLSDETKLNEIKLKAANYEIENLNKLLKITEDKLVNDKNIEHEINEKQNQEYLSLIRNDSEMMGRMKTKIEELEKNFDLLTNKNKLYKKKINLYKELNCVTCGENFYNSLVKLRKLYQQNSDNNHNDNQNTTHNGNYNQNHNHNKNIFYHVNGDDDGLESGNDDKELLNKKRNGKVTENVLNIGEGYSDDDERITRVGINGIRALRTQSANPKGRKKSPNRVLSERNISSAPMKRSSPSPPRRGNNKNQYYEEIERHERRTKKKERDNSRVRKRSPYDHY